jgi:hypothetical protein
MMGVYRENHTQHINTLRGHKAELLEVTADGIYWYYCAWKA